MKSIIPFLLYLLIYYRKKIIYYNIKKKKLKYSLTKDVEGIFSPMKNMVILYNILLSKNGVIYNTFHNFNSVSTSQHSVGIINYNFCIVVNEYSKIRGNQGAK